MAQSLTMQAGERNQLRALGDVERWTSSNPDIVAVTDEDITQGRPGGELTALAPGAARITAVGFSGKTLVEVDVTVGAAPAITVVAGATAQLEIPPGATGNWRTTNAQVVEVSQEGEVRGVSPGITFIRCDGGAHPVEFRVCVTGSLDIEVNHSLSLASRFDLPVRAWRAGSSSASIDSSGTVTAGDRPRTVPLIATLENGEEYSIDLRIIRSQGENEPAGRPVQPPAPLLSAPALELPTRTTPTADPDAQKAREVQGHLTLARSAIGESRWQAAGAEVAAAELAAAGDETLQEHVRVVRDQLRQQAAEGIVSECEEVAAALRDGDCPRARELLARIRVPREYRAVPSQLQSLTDTIESLQREEDLKDSDLTRLDRELLETWSTVTGTGMYRVLGQVGAIASGWGVEGMAGTIARTLAGPVLLAGSDSIRSALVASLRELGSRGLEEVCDALSNTPTGNAAGSRLLDVLVDLQSAKHARTLISLFRDLPAARRGLFVYWLGQLVGTASDELLDLVAGVLRVLPPDHRLARAIRAEVGVERLEKEAQRWASGGHRGARTVLERIYDYPASAFGTR